jgi:hypothetical protein
MTTQNLEPTVESKGTRCSFGASQGVMGFRLNLGDVPIGHSRTVGIGNRACGRLRGAHAFRVALRCLSRGFI